jgi:S-formylglutathione hydrolase FrmB
VAKRSRRRVTIIGALLVVAVALVAIVGAANQPLASDGAHVRHFALMSRLVHQRLDVTLVTPAAATAGRPLLVFLHGRGANQDSELSAELFAGLRTLGARAPVVVFPDGGDHSYWHDRSGAAWGSYVLREVIPTAVRLAGADGRRVAIGGISMGGFGAYDLARLAPRRFCAIGGHSAALWTSAGDTAAGAFDDSADFSRHDVIAAARARPGLYGNARLWLDGGDQDPFHGADETLAAALGIHMHVWPGAHNTDYWNAHWADYLNFYAAALAGCHPGAS